MSAKIPRNPCGHARVGEASEPTTEVPRAGWYTARWKIDEENVEAVNVANETCAECQAQTGRLEVYATGSDRIWKISEFTDWRPLRLRAPEPEPAIWKIEEHPDYLDVTMRFGVEIGRACREVQALADERKLCVRFRFNDVLLRAFPGCSADDIYKTYAARTDLHKSH